MINTPRALAFSASLHLTIFERPVDFEFFEQLFEGASGKQHATGLREEPGFLCVSLILMKEGF